MDLLKEWAAELASLNRAGHTIRAYVCDIRQLQVWLAVSGKRLEEATREDLRQFTLALHESGLAPRSRARRLVAVRRFYTWLVDSGKIPVNPAEKLLLPRVPHRRVPRFLREEEVARLLAVLATPRTPVEWRDRAMIELGLCGLRVSEVLSIRVDDLFLEAQQVRIRGKGGGERLVPLTPEAAEVLERWTAIRPRSSGFVFTALPPKGDKPLHPASVERILKRYLAKAGIPTSYGFHSLRHTAGYTLANQDVPLHVIQELLGHRDPRTTRTYTDLSPAHVREVVAHKLRYRRS